MRQWLAKIPCNTKALCIGPEGMCIGPEGIQTDLCAEITDMSRIAVPLLTVTNKQESLQDHGTALQSQNKRKEQTQGTRTLLRRRMTTIKHVSAHWIAPGFIIVHSIHAPFSVMDVKARLHNALVNGFISAVKAWASYLYCTSALTTTCRNYK